MGLNVQDFKSNFKGGFRANQYRVLLTFPIWVGAGVFAALQAPFLIQAASLPASTLGIATASYRGRAFKYSGDRTFEPWQITAYADTDFVLRNAFEAWMNGMNDSETAQGRLNAADYRAKAYVNALDRDDKVLYSYEMHDVFPSNVGEISLGFDQNDAIATFPVTLEMNYFTGLGNASRF